MNVFICLFNELFLAWWLPFLQITTLILPLQLYFKILHQLSGLQSLWQGYIFPIVHLSHTEAECVIIVPSHDGGPVSMLQMSLSKSPFAQSSWFGLNKICLQCFWFFVFMSCSLKQEIQKMARWNANLTVENVRVLNQVLQLQLKTHNSTFRQ